jgi:predicted transposase YdaD
MSHPIDANVKHLVTEWLPDWLPLSGRRADGPVEVIDADLSTVTAQADKVLRVGGEPPWLLHLELQSYRDPELAGRVHHYNALLEYRHGSPVWSVVVILNRPADHASLTGLFERGFPGERPYRMFRYQVVRVWEMRPERFLTGGLGTLPLAPLSDMTAEELPAVVARMAERFRQEAARETRGELWTASSVLMGLRYPRILIREIMQMAVNMNLEDNTFVQYLLEKGEAKGRVEGEAKGRAEGEAQGRAEEARKLLLRQGGVRFGSPPPQVERALAAITDLDRLEQLGERLLSVASWDELLAAS